MLSKCPPASWTILPIHFPFIAGLRIIDLHNLPFHPLVITFARFLHEGETHQGDLMCVRSSLLQPFPSSFTAVSVQTHLSQCYAQDQEHFPGPSLSPWCPQRPFPYTGDSKTLDCANTRTTSYPIIQCTHTPLHMFLRTILTFNTARPHPTLLQIDISESTELHLDMQWNFFPGKFPNVCICQLVKLETRPRIAVGVVGGRADKSLEECSDLPKPHSVLVAGRNLSECWQHKYGGFGGFGGFLFPTASWEIYSAFNLFTPLSSYALFPIALLLHFLVINLLL